MDTLSINVIVITMAQEKRFIISNHYNNVMLFRKVQAAAMAVVICSVVATFCLVSSAEEIQPADANSVTPSLSCPPGFVPQGNSCVCADWPNWIPH